RATAKNVTVNFTLRLHNIYIPATEPWSRLTLREESDFCSEGDFFHFWMLGFLTDSFHFNRLAWCSRPRGDSVLRRVARARKCFGGNRKLLEQLNDDTQRR